MRAVPGTAPAPRCGSWVLALLIALATGPAIARADACAGANPVLDAVRFSANAWIDQRGLSKMVGLDEPGVWSAEREAEVHRRLLRTDVFRAVGFRLSAEEERCVLVVDLDRRPIVSEVRLSGAALPRWEPLRATWRWVWGIENRSPLPTDREIRRLLRTRPGTLFDEEALDRATKRIVTRYHHAGYQSARVSTQVREDRGGVEIEVYIRPGAPLLVTEVESAVDGPDARRVVDDVLQAALGRAKSRHFERDTRRRLARVLREAGFFDAHIDVHWRQIDAKRGVLIAEVGAGRARRIELVGNESVKSSALLDLEHVYSRSFITNNTWRQMARAMRAEYQRRGYYRAVVEVDSDSEDAIVFRVEEGPRFKVKAVRFEGNATLAARELRDVVSTGHRSWLGPIRPPRAVESVLSDDVERVREHYQNAGFEQAAVSRRIKFDREAGTVVITFAVREGPRSHLRSVGWDPEVERLAEDLLPRVELARPLDIPAIDRERQRLLTQLRRVGYRDAQVDYSVRRAESGDSVDAFLSWHIDPGRLHRYGDVYVRGNAEVRYVVITRDVPFAAGAPIETDALLAAQLRIHDTGVFNNVSIEPITDSGTADLPADVSEDEREDVSPEDHGAGAPELDEQPVTGESDLVPIEVNVAARPPGRFGYGVGYDTRQGITGFAEVLYGNLNHRAQRLRIRGQIGFEPGDSDEPTQYLVTTDFREPRTLDGPWDLHLNAVAERNTRTLQQFNIERAGAGIGSGRQVNRRVRFGSVLQGEFARVFDVRPIPFLRRDERDAWTVSLSPYVIFDGRDSVFDPRSGFFESLRLRYAMPGVSTTDFVEVSAQHTHFIPLWRDWNFVYSLRAGWVHSLDGDPIVPIRQRYFIGGGESVRGFAINSLGPYDGNGREVGGDVAIVAKSELRIPLIGGLGWVLFVDGGGNYLVRCDSSCRAGDPGDPATLIRDAAFTFDNFRPTAGMGVRYVTPVGPISVDYGIKLDRRTRDLADGSSARESFGEFSVSIGAQF